MTNRTDNFNRADTTTNIGNPSDGGSAWVQVTAGAAWGIETNQAYESGGANQSICILESSVSNVDVESTVSVIGTDAGLIAREADDDNYILMAIRTSGNTLQIYKRVAGSFTSLATFTGALSNNDVLKLTVDSANNLTGFQNSTQRLTANDSAGSTNTKHGLRNGAIVTNDVRFDSFSITEIGSAAVQMFLINPIRVDGMGHGGIFPGNRVH